MKERMKLTDKRKTEIDQNLQFHKQDVGDAREVPFFFFLLFRFE